jgi:hypothetical protein
VLLVQGKRHLDLTAGEVLPGAAGRPYVNAARHDDSYEVETLFAALERAATS